MQTINLSKQESEILQIERASADLRNGFPVTVKEGSSYILIMAAECTNIDFIKKLDKSLVKNLKLAITKNRANYIFNASFDKNLSVSVSLDEIEVLALGKEKLKIEDYKPENATELENMGLKLLQIAELIPAMIVIQVANPQNNILTVESEEIDNYYKNTSFGMVRIAETPLALGLERNVRMLAYRTIFGGKDNYAIIVGEPEIDQHPLIRVHSSCYTGDLLGSLSCDCGEQLHLALESMDQTKEFNGGILIYLMQEGRGIGLANKLRAYSLQHQGLDTVDANLALGFDDDSRLFLPSIRILNDLGINSVTLLSNNPRKAKGLRENGIAVNSVQPIKAIITKHNKTYLNTKAKRLGHKLD